MFLRQGLQFCVSVVLARLLTPEEFGTVAMLAVFIAIASVISESGFSSALVQRREVSQQELSSVFYFTLALTVAAAGCLVLCAPLIAKFYRLPVLTAVIIAVSAQLVIGCLGSVHQVLLTRALDFRSQSYITGATQLVSGGVAVLLAKYGFGLWSIVTQSIVATTLTTALLWAFVPWRPSWTFSTSAIRSLFRFGGFLLASALLDAIFSRLNTILIGKFYSPSDLGYYSRADNTRLIPIASLAGIISRVSFPVFSSVNHDAALLREGLRRAITVIMAIAVPLMFGMALTARPLVAVLFGEKWLPSVPYLQILCFSGLLWPLHILNLNVLTAQGLSNLFFRLEVAKKVAGVAVLSAACTISVLAIAWSTLVSGVLSFIINGYYSGRLLGYGCGRQLIDIAPYLAAGAAMCIPVHSVALLPISSPGVLLGIQVAVGAFSYLAILVAFRLRAFVEVMDLVGPKVSGLFARPPNP